MTAIAIEPQGQLLAAAKQAAADAVAGYERLTPYTIGIAVQAAAAVLRAGASSSLDTSGTARNSE